MAFSSVAHAQTDLPTLSSLNLSLTDALKIAFENSVTLRQMQADAAVATAAAQGAQAQTRPSLSTTTYATAGDSANILTASPGVSPQNLFAVTPRGFADQNLMLMVPLYTGGKLNGNVTAALKMGEAAALSVQASRLSVAEAITEDYANVALQQSLVTVAQVRVTAEQEQARVTQEKVNVGRSAPVDLWRERAELADANQSYLAAQNGAALALVTLKTALGISQESEIALSDTLDTLAGATAIPAPLRENLRLSEANRPEMAAAQRRVEAAQSAIGAARGEYAAQVYGVAMADATAGQGVGRAGYTVGLTASLPLYDGGQRRADVDGAKAKLDRALADALQMRQQVDQETARAWLNVQTAMAQRDAVRAGVTAAQQGYDVATLRYNAGKSTTAERLDALAALMRAQGALAGAKSEIIVARVRLQAATGAATSSNQSQ